MKKLLILMISASLLLTTSCNNDDEDAEPAFTFDCTYMKVQEGTKFTYNQLSFGSTTPQTVVSEVVDQSEIDDTVVAVFESGNQESFITCDGDKFIITAPEVTIVDGVVTSTTNILLTLELGNTIGETYTAANLVTNTTAQGYMFQTFNEYRGEVVEKDLTMEVEGTTYTGVVQFKMQTFTSTSSDPSSAFLTTTTTYHIAPDVATIKAEIFDETVGVLLTTTTLVDYEY